MPGGYASGRYVQEVSCSPNVFTSILFKGGVLMTEKAKEKSKKKRSISSFTILLIMLVALALITVSYTHLDVYKRQD